MNRRKSLRGQLGRVQDTRYIPPFFEADVPVAVGVDLGEEVVQLAVGHRQASAAECVAQFVFRELAVAVVVDAAEQRQELFFGFFNKRPEFCPRELRSS